MENVTFMTKVTQVVPKVVHFRRIKALPLGNNIQCKYTYHNIGSFWLL